MKTQENILKMETRGCHFLEPHASDIGNYRITTTDYLPLKDGRTMFFEFTITDRYDYRTTNKRTGAPLRKPIRELVRRDVAHLNTCYQKEDGCCYRDAEMERSFWEALLPYTIETVLSFVNSVAATHYDSLAFV